MRRDRGVRENPSNDQGSVPPRRISGRTMPPARRRRQRGVFSGTEAVEATIHARIERGDGDPKPFVRAEDTDGVLGGVGRFRRRTLRPDNRRATPAPDR